MAKKHDEINPFVQTLVIPAIWKLETDSTEGEESSVSMSANVRLSDKDNRCQIFPKHLLGWFKDLPTSAKDMILWITLHLDFGKDVITIQEDKYCEELGVSRATFYSAKSAITNRIIIPRISRRNTYWVNPQYLFKGDRTKHYRSRVVIENENPLDKLK